MDKLTFHPTMLTYGMIGITTVVLAALTVFDSSSDNDASETEESYVSQLLGSNEEETGLVSSLMAGSEQVVEGGQGRHSHAKTRRRHHHKKQNKTRLRRE